MNDVLKEIRNKLTDSIFNKKEQLFKDAVEYAQGDEKWSNEEIAKRCRLEYHQDSRAETLVIDDVPMLVIFPFEWEQKETSAFSLTATTTFRYKELYKGE